MLGNFEHESALRQSDFTRVLLGAALFLLIFLWRGLVLWLERIYRVRAGRLIFLNLRRLRLVDNLNHASAAAAVLIAFEVKFVLVAFKRSWQSLNAFFESRCKNWANKTEGMEAL